MQSKTWGYLSFAFISVVWGTTYLITHIGVLHFPAILFTGIRHTAAGIVLLSALLLFKVRYTWTWNNIYPQLIAGIFILSFGNGLVSWSLHYIPSGLSALLCTLVPLNMIVLSLLTEKRQRVNGMIVWGLACGLAGMGFIFRDNIADIGNPQYLTGIVATILATVSWSAGSLYTRRNSASGHPLFKAALQLLSGGLFLLIVSLFTEHWGQLPAPDRPTLLALAYLVLIGSAAAFAAYQYALATLPPEIISVYAYINPLVALMLGYSLLNERLTGYTFAAFVLTVTGIYFINRGYKRLKSKQPTQNPPPPGHAVNIREYEPSLQPYFERFNKAWLEEYFSVEPIDRYVLENPEEAILLPGGRIFFAEYKGHIIGTVALLKVDAGVFELTKMAVDKTYQGLGAGRLLCQTAIDEARRLNAHTLILYSQTILTTALNIYRKMGFIDVPLEDGKYKRADVKMKMSLNQAVS